MSPKTRSSRRSVSRHAPGRIRAGAGAAVTAVTATATAAVLAVSLVPGAARALEATPPGPGPARPMKLPTITEKRLDNGLLVVLAPLATVPKVSAILAFHASRGSDSDTAPGVAMIASSTINEGTATRTSKQIKEELRSIGGTLGVQSDTDATSLVASSLSEFSPRLFELMADIASHPSFPESEVTLAKTNLVERVRQQRSSPDFLANERLQKAVFGAHPYSFVVPDEKAVTSVTPAGLKTFAAKWLVPGNAHLIVVGDFEPEKLLAEVTKAFGSWTGGPAPVVPNPPLPTRDRREIQFVERPGSVQSTILLGNAVIPRKDPDYFALRTANTIFAGSFYSRLTLNIREGKGYTYSPFSSADTRALAGIFFTGASVRNEVTGPTLLEIFYELDRMRVAPVTDEELTNAKAFSVGNFAIELATEAGLAGRLNTVYVYDLDRKFVQDFRSKIDALTPADIQRAAAKYFDSYRAAVVVCGDYAKVGDAVKPFGDVRRFDAEGKEIAK